MYAGGEGEGEDEGRTLSFDEMGASIKEELRTTSAQMSMQISQLKSEIQQKPDINDALKKAGEHLKAEIFGESWESLDIASKCSLMNAEHQWMQENLDDYSGAANQFIKGLEIEIRIRVLAPYKQHLLGQNIDELPFPRKTLKVKSLIWLDLPLVRDLLKAWNLSRNRPSKLSVAELALFSAIELDANINDYLDQFSEDQRNLVLMKINEGLVKIPDIGRHAKHIGIVPRQDTTDLRSIIVGSKSAPGLIPELIRLLPS